MCKFFLFLFLNLVGNVNLCCTCCDCTLPKEEFFSALNKKMSEIQATINDNNISNQILNNEIDGYYEMYNEMVNDIFKSEAVIELMGYRELLRREGIVNALNDIFDSNKHSVSYYPSIDPLDYINTQAKGFYLKESDKKGEYKIVIVYEGEEEEHSPKDLEEMKLFGGIYIDNKPFYLLRCDGYKHDDNEKTCISCLFANILKKIGVLENRNIDTTDIDKDPFGKIFIKQGYGSHNSDVLRKLIFLATKKQWFFKYNSSIKFQQISNESVDENIKKCFYIEWALTIELLIRLAKIINDKDDNKNIPLFRTINKEHLKKEYYSRRDLFESTSLFTPAYRGVGNSLGEIIKYNAFVKFEQVPIYRCIFNYIISPNSKSILEQEYSCQGNIEQEVGCITMNLDFKELFNEEEEYTSKESAYYHNRGIKKTIDEGFIFWNRKKYLIRSFLECLRKDLEKNKKINIKKIIFERGDIFYDWHKETLTGCFYATNEEYSISFLS